MVMRLPARVDPGSRCRDPGHKPPKDLSGFMPGSYSHNCPSCGRATWFVVELPEIGSVSADVY